LTTPHPPTERETVSDKVTNECAGSVPIRCESSLMTAHHLRRRSASAATSIPVETKPIDLGGDRARNEIVDR
jgi:hypothetical protein